MIPRYLLKESIGKINLHAQDSLTGLIHELKHCFERNKKFPSKSVSSSYKDTYNGQANSGDLVGQSLPSLTIVSIRMSSKVVSGHTHSSILLTTIVSTHQWRAGSLKPKNPSSSLSCKFSSYFTDKEKLFQFRTAFSVIGLHDETLAKEFRM